MDAYSDSTGTITACQGIKRAHHSNVLVYTYVVDKSCNQGNKKNYHSGVTCLETAKKNYHVTNSLFS